MFLQDLRFAFRTLRNSPGYTFVAMLSLALGIGANSTIYSLAEALLLRPLPVAEPGDVVTIRGVTPSDMFAQVSYRDFTDLQANAKSFDGLVALTTLNFGYAVDANTLPQVKLGLAVSGNFFSTMGVVPQVGREFRPDEDKVDGRDAVAVISYDLWEKEFHSSSSVLGRKVRLNGIEFTIIGVSPQSFTGMDQYLRPALYVPAHMVPSLGSNTDKSMESRSARRFAVKGRLKSGVSLRQAEAELTAIAANLEKEYPDTNKKYSFVVRTELQQRIEQSPPDAMLVALLMGMVGLVLLIACANVTNLMLSRARARSREMAVRLALGASRRRLIVQLLTESMVVAAGGGVLGLLFAVWGTGIFGQIQIPTDLPIVITIQVDQRVVLFTVLAAIVSALISGLAPAIQTSKSDLVTSLKAGDQGLAERKRFLGRNALVVMQVALSTVLLVSASMMVRTVNYLIRTNPGFRTEKVLTMVFDPALVRYKREQTEQYYQRLLETARAVPGVKSVTLSSVLPLANQQDGFDVAPDGYKFAKGEESTFVFGARVTEDYFSTMGVTLIKGRPIRAEDTAKSPRVVIVNQEFINKYWKGQDAIGKRIQLNGQKELAEVIGIAETAPVIYIAEPPTPQIYVPFRQHYRSRMKLMVYTEATSASLAVPIREAVKSLDPNLPVFDIRTIESFYQMRAISVSKMIAQTFAGAGLMGLVLSLVGLYGVVSFSVSRRTREIGIRIAVGAKRGQVLNMVLRHGLLLSLIGLGIGLIASLGAGRLLQQAFQMPAVDPIALTVVPAGLLLVTLLASYIPARRASRTEPVRALRWE